MDQFLIQACTGFGQQTPGFMKLLLSAKLVCLCVCMCARVCVCPKAINYIHVILNLFNHLNKYVTFRNVTKLSMHKCGFCNEAHYDRNQSNKAR